MTEREPARGTEQRKQDALDRLEQDEDVWVATVSADGVPCLVPLSFVWARGTLLLLIEGTAGMVEGADLPAESGDAFAAKLR